MSALFADLPEALDSTLEIARRCSYFPTTRDPILPRFAARDAEDAEAAIRAEAEELARQAREGLATRLATPRPDRRLHARPSIGRGWITSSASSSG